ncbi:hypothetical protein, partial [Streptococcus pneumoniae]|uniref:hypothetical protein n=1 Tax=Streptococcus pneumoniae TaxID=1313 RepID=UPI001E5F141A
VNDDNIDYAGLLPLDSSTFKGGGPKLYVFSSTNALGSFSGTPMAATFTGGDVEMHRNRNSRLKRGRPDVDTASGLTLS